jgi:V-type H+-transporting ATPase subunit E
MGEVSQVTQMREFILNEAKDKAEEIDAKALQEFTIEKFKIVSQTKQKIRDDFQKKMKQEEVKSAIARSSAINKSRLDKIKSRQDVIGKVAEETRKALAEKLKAEATNKAFVTKLIVQGLLMLLEDNVQVRCRASDDKLVTSCLEDAAKEYSAVIAKETGAKKTAKLSLDSSEKLSPSLLGGIVLVCQGSTITIDNTIDARMGLVLEQAKPNIRKLMFS